MNQKTVSIYRLDSASDKKGYKGLLKDKFQFFCIKTYFVTPSLELSQRDSSNVGSQNMFPFRNKVSQN